MLININLYTTENTVLYGWRFQPVRDILKQRESGLWTNDDVEQQSPVSRGFLQLITQYDVFEEWGNISKVSSNSEARK